MSNEHETVSRPEVSVAIPCYNEAANVRAIYEAVTAQLVEHTADYEIVFIDNHSSDTTRDLLREVVAEDKRVRAIFNTRNYGQMRSPTYSIYQCDGAAVIAMCADFQDPPETIGPMIEQWRAGAEIVLARRRTERATWGKALSRAVGYRLLTRSADYQVLPGVTGFGLFTRRVVDTLAAWNEPEPFFRGMLIESGFRYVVIPVDRPERRAGKSKNDYAALRDFALSGLAASAKSLLRLPLDLAVGAVAIAGLLLLAACGGFLLHWPVATFLLLASLQFGLAGVVLFFLGLIGEQVRVISERTRRVPLVLESERIGFPAGRQRPSSRTAVVPVNAADD